MKLRNMVNMSKARRVGKYTKNHAGMNRCWLLCAIFVLLSGSLSLSDTGFRPVPNGATFGQWRTTPFLQENFDSDQPSWEILYIDPSGKFTERARVSDVAVSGKSETYQCEFVSSGIYFVGHPILLPYMIEDLNAGIWVRSQETGMVCTLEVVLPGSTDPDGKPVTLLLPGDQYSHIGEWQQLRVKADMRALERQAETLRLELKVPIDTSLAYVRRLVLCCYVTGKSSRIWLDDLHADGIMTIPGDLREKYEEPLFNPKNVLWVFRQIGLYNDTAPGINVRTEPTAIADVNWTRSQRAEPLPTISHDDPPARSLIPQELLSPARTMSWQDARQTGRGFHHDANAPTLLIPNNPIMMVANPNGTNGLVTQPVIDGQEGWGNFTSLPSTRLSERPDLYQPAYAGGFPEHILEDRISRGKPHDGCRIDARAKMLMINGNLPYGVRAIEYRGEPLAFLAGLQFNTIWMRQPPTEALLDEAWQLGVWIICPPPDFDNLQSFVGFLNNNGGMTDDGTRKADGGSLGIMGRMFARNRNPILAWDIGRNLTHGEIERVRKYAGLVRDADDRRIPIVGSAESGTRDYSRNIADILLIDRNPILSSLELSDYNTWLNTKVHWARPGTPNWCTIQTQPTEAMLHQWRLFGVGDIPAAAVSEEHVRQQIRMAMANECRGLLFTSNSRLDADYAETKYRAALLELVNMELMLIEGWFSTNRSQQVVRSNSTGVGGILLETDRARLLLPNISVPFGQYVMGNTNYNNVDFLMPGSFETHQANHLIPGGTRPLTLRRVTGGVQVHFDEVNTTTASFFAQAEPILRAVIPRSRHPELGRRSAELAMELAKMRLEQVRKTIRAFQEIQAMPEGLPDLSDGKPIITMSEQESMLRETERSIGTAESYYRQGDFSSAYLQAHRSIAGLQFYERLQWGEAIRNVQHHNMNMVPASVSFVTLPAYIETIKKMVRMKPGENRLPTGDGEDANQWLQAGWRSLRATTEGVAPDVAVADSSAARSGMGGILIRLSPSPSTPASTGGTATLISDSSAENSVIPLETASVWITTPQIPVYAGETLCITGYVNIPQKLQGNVDGLMIFDSLGGEPLALRLTDTGGQWRQFAFYRIVPTAVPPNASICVTFALGGLGEVRLDDLQIFPIIPDPDAPPPATGTPAPGSGWPQLPQLPKLW